MTWRTQWAAIAGRISGLIEAGQIIVDTLRISSHDSYGASNRVSQQARELLFEIESFASAFGEVLPPNARDEIARFIQEEGPRIRDVTTGLNSLQVCLPSLAWLRAAVQYHLTDIAAVATRVTERAFIHLRSLLVADEGTQRQWRVAFDRGEVACERLGAAHLLQHGIWCFKASGIGARTDLVLGEPLTDPTTIERAADALVLTEWKLIRDQSAVGEVAAAARTQAHLYGTELLSGIELARYRYIVLVSLSRMPHLEDVLLNDVLYRHVNLVISPVTPSRAVQEAHGPVSGR